MRVTTIPGEPYQDQGKLKMRGGKKDGYKDAGHDFAFRPAKDMNVKVKSAFTHMTDLNTQKKVYRNADGEVITEPKNFLTNPMKKGANGR